MTYTTEQIKEMLAKITPGEWIAARRSIYLGDIGKICDAGEHTQDDADFIAAAPTIVRQLLEEIEDLQKMEQVQKDNSRAQFKAMEQENSILRQKIEELEKNLEIATTELPDTSKTT